MGKTTKILAGIVAFLLLVTASLAAFVRFYLTDERIKALVLPAAEKALHRKVELGAIQVGLFTGITLTDFAIKETDGQTDFIKADGLVLRYDLWPLLQKRLAISTILLDHPFVRIHRDRNGAFNFDTLPFLAAKDKASPEPAAGQNPPLALTVEEVAISKARLVLSDATGALPASETVANATVNLAVDSSKQLVIQGKTDFTSTITYGGLQPVLRVEANFDPTRLRYEADLVLENEKMHLAGEVRDYRTTPQLGVHLTAKTLDLDKLLAMFAKLPKKAAATKAAKSGPADHPVKKFGVQGSVKIDTLRFQELQVNNLAADFDPGQLKFAAKVAANSETFGVDGTMRDYLTAPQVICNLTAQTLTVDTLLALTASGKAKAKAAAAPPPPAKPLADRLPKNLTAQGKISVADLRFKQLAITNFILPYRLQNGVLAINKLTATLAGGTLLDNTTVDLRPLDPTFKGDLAVRGLQLKEFLSGMLPQASYLVGGNLEASLTYSGKGFQWEKLQKALLADGSYAIKGGILRNTPVTTAVATVIGLPELSDLDISEAAGTVHIADGRVNQTSRITGQDLAIQAAGSIGFDTTISMPVVMRFSPRLSQKLQQRASLTRYLANDAGETVIKLRVGGTLANPRPELDPAMVREQAERVIKKKLFEQLEKSLGGQQQPAPDQSDQQPPPSPAQQLLRGILGM